MNQQFNFTGQCTLHKLNHFKLAYFIIFARYYVSDPVFKDSTTEVKSASLRTWQRAISDVTDISFHRKKGQFSTCEICLVGLDLLCKSKDKFQRELVNKYRNRHLIIQQAQRDAMDRTIDECKEFDQHGNPVMAFILSDAISNKRGDTPVFKSRIGNKAYKIDDNKPTIGDRMFGCLVVCGNINAYFVFHCHDFVGGGAHIAIEITRLTLLKLAELLAAIGQKLPKRLALQGDNCGENKNKFMFAYLSLLVELSIFDQIRFSFLIVGHTHCIIDQYFSVITKLLEGAFFIATPLAIEQLLNSKDSGSKFSIPRYQTHIHGIPDFKSAFESFINPDIKFYQVGNIFY